LLLNLLFGIVEFVAFKHEVVLVWRSAVVVGLVLVFVLMRLVLVALSLLLVVLFLPFLLLVIFIVVLLLVVVLVLLLLPLLFLSFAFTFFFLIFVFFLEEGRNAHFHYHLLLYGAKLLVILLALADEHVLLLLVELVAQVVEVEAFVLVLLVGLGADPLAPAVLAVTDDAFEATGVLGDFLEVV